MGLLDSILAFLWSKAGYIVAIVLGIIVYELLKAGAKASAKRLGRYLAHRGKYRTAVGIVIALCIVLAVWFVLVVL